MFGRHLDEVRVERDGVGENGVQLAVVVVTGFRQVEGKTLALRQRQGNKLVGASRAGQRLPDQAIRDGENRSARADAEPEGQNGYSGESGVFEEGPNRETNVAPECVHGDDIRFRG